MICFLSVDLAAQKKFSHYYDGPYIFTVRDTMKVHWIAQGKLQEQYYIGDELQLDEQQLKPPTINGRDISYYKALADHGTNLDHQVEYNDVPKLAAISDIHGQYDLMLNLFKRNEIVNEYGNWAYGDGHLVIAGDIFDRGDKVIDIVWYLIRLEQQAKRAGGKVHTLIGNHEWMVLNADVRYINKKYRFTSAKFRRPYNELFGFDSFLGSWIRSKPIYIKVNGIAFVHGGINEELFQYMSIGDLNKVYYDKVLSSDKIVDESTDQVVNFLTNIKSPLWYRGYAFKDDYDKKRTDKLLKMLDAKRIVVGHTSMPEIVSKHNNKIIFIDSNIKLGKKGEMLLVENKKIYRANHWGQRTKLN